MLHKSNYSIEQISLKVNQITVGLLSDLLPVNFYAVDVNGFFIFCSKNLAEFSWVFSRFGFRPSYCSSWR